MSSGYNEQEVTQKFTHKEFSGAWLTHPGVLNSLKFLSVVGQPVRRNGSKFNADQQLAR